MENLKRYRELKKMSQEELAEKSGISRVTISLLETGKQTIAKSNTIVQLADALGVEPQILLCPKRSV